MDTIQPLVRKEIPSVKPQDRLARVAQILSKTRSNIVLVQDRGTLVGSVMRRQLLRSPLSLETKAERLLFHPPLLRPDATQEDAIALALQSRCDLLPVGRDNRLQGVVLARDLAAQDPSLEAYSVSDLVDQAADPLSHLSSLGEVAAVLRDLDFESIPLADEVGNLLGWVCFSDLQRYLVSPERGVRRLGEFAGEKDRPLRNPAKTLARQAGIKIPANMNLQRAVEILRSEKANELTIVEDGSALGHISILRILASTRQRADVLVQVAGLEEEDPLVVSQILDNLKSTAIKIQGIWKNMGTPELKVKTYERGHSGRKRYEVKVSFTVPDLHMAKAEGWNLLAAATQALKKIERDLIETRSKVVHSHRRRGVPGGEGE